MQPRAGRDVVRLGVGDAGELLTLQRGAYAQQAQAHSDPWLPPLTQTLEDLRHELTLPTILALGIRLPMYHGARLVAAVRLHRVEASDGSALAQVNRLVVAPDLQGHGLGSALLAAAQQDAGRPPIGPVDELRLFTGEHSTANLRLYERFGYVETGRSDSGSGYLLVHLSRAPDERVSPT